VKQIQLRIEGRENGDLGAVAPWSGVPLKLQMNETHILIRLLRMYSGASVPELNPFLEAVREPKCS
jgi:hypothetical protein